MILMHLKAFRNNFFLIISNTVGKTLFSINSGSLGFKNIKKNSLEALKIMLKKGFTYSLHLNSYNIFLKVEVSLKFILYELYKQFLLFINTYKINISVLKVINKITYSGIRKKCI